MTINLFHLKREIKTILDQMKSISQELRSVVMPTKIKRYTSRLLINVFLILSKFVQNFCRNKSWSCLSYKEQKLMTNQEGNLVKCANFSLTKIWRLLIEINHWQTSFKPGLYSKTVHVPTQTKSKQVWTICGSKGVLFEGKMTWLGTREVQTKLQWKQQVWGGYRWLNSRFWCCECSICFAN